MFIINRNDRFLAGSDGERITVIVKSQNTNHGVPYVLDGQKGVMNLVGGQTSMLRFTLNKAEKDPSQLLMLFLFSSNGGGIYRVLITGSEGGQPFGDVIRQLGDDDRASSGYNFDVI